MEYLEFFSRATSICKVDTSVLLDMYLAKTDIYTMWSFILFFFHVALQMMTFWIPEFKEGLASKISHIYPANSFSSELGVLITKNQISYVYIQPPTTFAIWKTYLAQCQLVHTNVVKISKNYTWNLVKWRERPPSFESQNVYELKSFIWSAALVCVASVVVVTIVVAYLCGWLFEFE